MSTPDRLALSPVQQHVWDSLGGPRLAAPRAGAVRVLGDMTAERLVEAIVDVVDSTDILRAGFTDGPAGPTMTLNSARPLVSRAEVDDAEECLKILLAERDSPRDPCQDPLVRIHVLHLRPGDLVLGVVADPLLLDLRSAYLLLGAILQAAVGRYRPDSTLAPQQIWPLVSERQAKLTPARRSWWAERLSRWSSPMAGPVPDEQAQPSQNSSGGAGSRRLSISADASNPGDTVRWTEVIAALAWSMRITGDGRVAPVLTGGLDLRDVLGLPAAMGPFTDLVVFDVDLEDVADPQAAVIRAHASMLDAVVHHVPYANLTALGLSLGTPAPPQPGRADHVVVHHCRVPLSSRHTRGDPGLGRLGLSIELFGQAELVGVASASAALEVQLAETGNALELILDHDPGTMNGARMDALLLEVSRFLAELAAR